MTVQSADINEAFRTMVGDFESTFARGDAAGVAAFYTDNAMLLPTGFDVVLGKRDIEAYWQEAMKMGIKTAKLDAMEVEQHGDTAIEVGKYTLSGADDEVMDHGKGIAIWKYEDGSWKIHRDIFNSSIAQQ